MLNIKDKQVLRSAFITDKNWIKESWKTSGYDQGLQKKSGWENKKDSPGRKKTLEFNDAVIFLLSSPLL